ncbi:MAG: DUF1667 domain-containing protein [Lachnospiraceae bacterium]
METVEMTCIRCPLGCALTAVKEEGGTIAVTGNTCPRGAEYARNELTDPRRMVTSTVRIAGRRNQVLSVKTATDIPKGKIQECVEALKQAEVTAPVHIGDIILKNVADTGVDIVATKTIL